MGSSARPRVLLGAVIATCSVLVATACSTTLHGNAVSVFDDPFSVAGMPATDGPTGLRANAEGPTRDIEGTDGGGIDELAGSAVSDIEQYWESAYPETFDEGFTPVKALISWDSDGFDGTFCEENTYGLVNAAYCYSDKTIGWDRGELLPGLRRAHGDMGVVMVLAHEYGHAVARAAGLSGENTPTLVSEQQADCLGGAYMRWVAEDNSPRYTLSTGEGLNNVLAGVISFRDPVLNEGDPDVGFDEHGSAFERLSAFQFGFTDGPSACAGIDMREIGQRRGDLPVLLPEDQTGELAITEDSVRRSSRRWESCSPPSDPPVLSFDADGPRRHVPMRDRARRRRTVRPPTPSPSTCPACRNSALATMARCWPPVTTSPIRCWCRATCRPCSDEHGGVALDNAEAALRTACLTGVATVKMSKDVTTPDGQTIALTAGDVDEAISGMLTNGLAASDVNGESVPSGFSRIDAFRVGVLGDTEPVLQAVPVITSPV